MKNSASRTVSSAKSGRFVLSRSKGEKISAVEGMKLSKRMDKILTQNAGGDQRRSLILQQVRGK